MNDLLTGFSPRVTLQDQIACVEREIRKRRLVYPRLIQTGRMSTGQADREIEVMGEVLATLQHLFVEAHGKPNPT